MPLQRRIPKRGFTQRKRTVYQIVNVGDLGRIEGTTVTAELLKEAGLIRSATQLVKILATGEVGQAYTVEAHKFSGGAVTKIEAAGGSTTVLTSGGSDSRAKGSKLQKKREPVKAAKAAPVVAEADVEAPAEEVTAEADTDEADAPVDEVDAGEVETDG